MILEEAQELVAEEENYFVSMTDLMVGLVFVFIILLMYFALQFQDVTEELSGANATRTQILEDLEKTLKEKGVPVIIDREDGVLRLPDSILFDSAQSDLKNEGREAVGHLAEALMDVLPCYSEGVKRSASCPKSDHRIESVYVEGHTDSDRFFGRGGLKDNWDLSVVRATNTYRALIDFDQRLGALCALKGNQCDPILSVSGYGPQRPVPQEPGGTSEERKAHNRRIDLRLIMKTPDAGEAQRALADRLSQK
ncbi:OmpA/MotB family protein [Sphingobium yanoikuyae]|uniref:OmpA/MotB family protein n=1 Tax=Sphingobium TaxID=165695 RepID=UPI0028A7A801|nr:OmpA family protein [Sphingobium yanoikuyae]